MGVCSSQTFPKVPSKSLTDGKPELADLAEISASSCPSEEVAEPATPPKQKDGPQAGENVHVGSENTAPSRPILAEREVSSPVMF